MHRCLISFGANIGDARGSVLAAERLLKQLLRAGDRVQLSRLYQTPPVGGPSGQAPFVNAVAAVETQLSPWEVWHIIRSIEQQLGRERIKRWEARRIDLDILLFDQHRIWTPQLKIPHPRMCMRRFILQPAADVAPDWLDPVSQMTIGELSNLVALGPASLILASSPDLQPQQLIQQAALRNTQTFSLEEMFGSSRSTLSVDNSQIRIVSFCDTSRLMERLSHPVSLSRSAAKLIVIWESSASENCAWEDQHRKLAIRLRLVDSDTNPNAVLPLPLIGPRYLLATSDTDWAAHEIAAALDAMDCPVELVP